MFKRLRWFSRAVLVWFKFRKETGNQKDVPQALQQYCYLCTECGSSGSSEKILVDDEYNINCPGCKAEFINIENVLRMLKYWRKTIRYIVTGRYYW